MDTGDIRGGQSWIDSIAAAVSNAYAMVSVVSPSANRSEWVRLEYLHAKKQGKIIIPLVAEPVELPIYMADTQAIFMQPDYGQGFGQLLRDLPPTSIQETKAHPEPHRVTVKKRGRRD